MLPLIFSPKICEVDGFVLMKQKIFLFIWYILVFMCFLNSFPWESCLCFRKPSSFHFSVGHLLWKSVLGRAMQIPYPWQRLHPLDVLLGCQFPFFTDLIRVILRRKYCIFYIITLLIFSHWRHCFDIIQIKDLSSSVCCHLKTTY